jgi:hypothetical protein
MLGAAMLALLTDDDADDAADEEVSANDTATLPRLACAFEEFGLGEGEFSKLTATLPRLALALVSEFDGLSSGGCSG